MTDVADDLVAWLLDRVQVSAAPPIDVENLARAMGIDSIMNATMIEDGRLEQDGRSAVIYLREGLPESRRRFTIAHELGHRLLLHPRAPAERYRRRLIGDSEERLCDDIAAAILLPRSWVAAHFRQSPHTLNTVRRLAGGTNTSMSASLVRLCEVAGWQESLLRFRLVNQRWRLDAPAAVPLEIHGLIRTTIETSDKLTDTGENTGRDVRVELPLRVGSIDHLVPAEVSVRRTVAVSLVNLRGVVTHVAATKLDGVAHRPAESRQSPPVAHPGSSNQTSNQPPVSRWTERHPLDGTSREVPAQRHPLDAKAPPGRGTHRS